MERKTIERRDKIKTSSMPTWNLITSNFIELRFFRGGKEIYLNTKPPRLSRTTWAGSSFASAWARPSTIGVRWSNSRNWSKSWHSLVQAACFRKLAPRPSLATTSPARPNPLLIPSQNPIRLSCLANSRQLSAIPGHFKFRDLNSLPVRLGWTKWEYKN